MVIIQRPVITTVMEVPIQHHQTVTAPTEAPTQLPHQITKTTEVPIPRIHIITAVLIIIAGTIKNSY